MNAVIPACHNNEAHHFQFAMPAEGAHMLFCQKCGVVLTVFQTVDSTGYVRDVELRLIPVTQKEATADNGTT